MSDEQLNSERLNDIPRCWRERTAISYLLFPLSVIFAVVINLRRRLLPVFMPRVPLIIIGNLSVGGNGKTPLVLALTKALLQKGIAVGVISRGCGGKANKATLVDDNANAAIVGDEALLLFANTKVPVVVGKNRVAAQRFLLENFSQIKIIISDDGLQHYSLGRTVEVVAIARDFAFGNGWLLPAGPLREPIKRLLRADCCVVHGEGRALSLPENVLSFQLQTKNDYFYRLDCEKWQPITAFTTKKPLFVLTAIARPQRFINTLKSFGYIIKDARILPDHAAICESETQFAHDGYLWISEKDAVKTKNWSAAQKARTFVLLHRLQLTDEFIDFIMRAAKISS